MYICTSTYNFKSSVKSLQGTQPHDILGSKKIQKMFKILRNDL